MNDADETSDGNYLQERKNFLLQSLHDLDQEYEAENLNPSDYAALVASYSRQLADVALLEDSNDVPRWRLPRGLRNRTVLWALGLVLIGGLAGIVISQNSGSRAAGSNITGGLRQSVVTQLSQAQNLLGDPERWDEAISTYDKIIQNQPSNAEALTYRAWLNYQLTRIPEEQIPVWEEVLLLEPEYPDAMVFLAVALAAEEEYDQASVLLDSLDAIGAPLGILEVVLSQGLYGKVYGEARYLKIIEIEEPSLEDLQVNSKVALEIANYLLLSAKEERTVSAIKVYRAILMEQPYHPEALSREALLLAQTGNQLLYERAVELLNLAVENNPDNLEAVLSRVSVRAVVDQEGACEDLVIVDQLLEKESQSFSEQMVLQVERIRAEVNCR
ncbi:MAG: hypothetical protein L7S58_04325 [Acidimicrobiales bacterium]|nr:hypothetical protein [Acidimicrobiales bacterium]